MKHNAARERLGMGLMHKQRKKKILPKPPPGAKPLPKPPPGAKPIGQRGKKKRNNFKIPIRKRQAKREKTHDLMVNEVMEDFHSSSEQYNMEVELIRNKQIERTKQKLALRRERRRQMLEDQKRQKERSEKWKRSISVTRLMGTRDKSESKASHEKREQKTGTQTTEVSSSPQTKGIFNFK